MVILERPRQVGIVELMPNKKNGAIVRLEDRIHVRRQAIKGLVAELQALNTLLNTSPLAEHQFYSTKREEVVHKMQELNLNQHLDRKQLRPHKRATETKGKSPFNHTINIKALSESKSGARRVQPRAKVEATSMRQKPKSIVIYERRRPEESNTEGDPLATRINDIRIQLESLRIQKLNGEISPKEYRARQQELASKLNEAERQRGHKPIRTKGGQH